MAAAEITVRRATLDDLGAIVPIVQTGFETYREFLPAGWEPPGEEADLIAAVLGEPDTWAAIAVVGETPVGNVGFVPGRERRAADSGPRILSATLVEGLAHL